MDGLDLLVVPGSLKSLLQHYSSKWSIFRRSAFFIVQLSHPYMTTGKTIALTRRTFVDKVIRLLLTFSCTFPKNLLGRNTNVKNFNTTCYIIWKEILALFVVMLPKAHLTSHSTMSDSSWLITPSWLSWLWRSFIVQFFCVFLPPLQRSI